VKCASDQALEGSMTAMATTVEKLCNASVNDYANPYEVLHWEPVLDKHQWFTSPELMSVYNTETWENLTQDQRQLLSFFEAVNFYSLNINGEKPLVEGIAHRMYRNDTMEISPYLHHFLDEENKHMTYFGGFCSRYAGKIYADKKILFPKQFEPGEEDFLFFAKVMIFEEFVDVLNLRMSLDGRLNPIARQINQLHHHDEARHLVFGRKFVAELWDKYSSKWSKPTREGIQKTLKEYLAATWKEYYNPQVYKDAGIANPFDVAEQAYNSAIQRAHRREVSARCIKYLLTHGMIDDEPETV
jgi:hypothetical protein